MSDKLYGKSSCALIPDLFESTTWAWEDYVADIWKTLLIHRRLNLKQTIIEVAPGCSSKIGRALEKISFEGVYYLVDPLQESLDILYKDYKQRLPKASLHLVCNTLQEALCDLPKQPDFLVAHHPLDDMLLSRVAGKATVELFQCKSESHQQARTMLENSFDEAIACVIQSLAKAIEDLRPSTSILCQYASLILTQNQAHKLNEYAKEALKGLKRLYQDQLEPLESMQALLNTHENFSNAFIGKEVLNANHWMMLKLS